MASAWSSLYCMFYVIPLIPQSENEILFAEEIITTHFFFHSPRKVVKHSSNGEETIEKVLSWVLLWGGIVDSFFGPFFVVDKVSKTEMHGNL